MHRLAKLLLFVNAITDIYLCQSSNVKLISQRITAKLIAPYKLLAQTVDLNGPYQSINTDICSTVLEVLTKHRTCFINACAKKNRYTTVFCSYQDVQTAYMYIRSDILQYMNES